MYIGEGLKVLDVECSQPALGQRRQLGVTILILRRDRFSSGTVVGWICLGVALIAFKLEVVMVLL